MAIKTESLIIPASMLLRLAHPDAGNPPYTVETLLMVINEYDRVLEQANQRFEAIDYIQTNNRGGI